MEFGWINGINLTAVILLILINIVALKTGDAEGFSSKYRIINVLEQIGRYGCMIFMVLPIWIKNWKFGFQSVGEMFLWIASTVILLLLYGFLWIKKRRGRDQHFVRIGHYSSCFVSDEWRFAAALFFDCCFAFIWCMPFDDCSGKSELNIPAGGVQRCSFSK